MSDRDVAMVYFGLVAGICLMAWLGRGRKSELTYTDGFNAGSRMTAQTQDFEARAQAAEDRLAEKIATAIKS